MEAKELMIGDWVQVPSELNRYKHINSTFDMDEAVLYRPIPLTAEILEKNGWKNISNHTLKGCETYELYIEQNSFDYYVTIKLRDYFKLDSLDDRLYTLCNMQFGCNYVHELQHALKLCGITHEISL